MPTPGGVAERLNAPALKAGRGRQVPRGFESHPLRLSRRLESAAPELVQQRLGISTAPSPAGGARAIADERAAGGERRSRSACGWTGRFAVRRPVRDVGPRAWKSAVFEQEVSSGRRPWPGATPPGRTSSRSSALEVVRREVQRPGTGGPAPQDSLLLPQQLLERLLGLLRPDEREHLDLVELVAADRAALLVR